MFCSISTAFVRCSGVTESSENIYSLIFRIVTRVFQSPFIGINILIVLHLV